MMNHASDMTKNLTTVGWLMQHFSNPTLTLLTALGILFSVLALV